MKAKSAMVPHALEMSQIERVEFEAVLDGECGNGHIAWRHREPFPCKRSVQASCRHVRFGIRMHDGKSTEALSHPPERLVVSNPLEHFLKDGTGHTDRIGEKDQFAQIRLMG